MTASAKNASAKTAYANAKTPTASVLAKNHVALKAKANAANKL